MKMKSLILILIALGCGLVASIGISQVMERGGGAKIEMEQILVAKDAIDIGDKFDATLVQLEEWPKIKIPEGATRKIEDVQNKYATFRFVKGEPILQAKISDKPGGVGEIIPAGYRVTPIKVDEDTVMEAITPGDTVDVNVFLEAGRGSIAKTGVFTILRNVRVFSKGSQTERVAGSDGKEVKARTVSLLVKPEQARELFLAYKLGKISLALRPPGATDDPADENVTSMDEILAGKGSLATEPKPGDAPQGGGFGSALGSFLGGLASAGEQTGPKPAHSMLLLSPTGASQFQWVDKDSPPVEHRLNINNSSAPAPPAPPPAPGAATAPPPPAGTIPTPSATP
jgi:pilus assembly protein CpaB